MERRRTLCLPMIFWNKSNADIRHLVTSLAVCGEQVATGAVTGDIVLWRAEESKCTPVIIATPSLGLECRKLVFLRSPFPTALGVALWVASLHDDRRIRLWDWEDGRCASVSEPDLLSPLSRPVHMVEIQQRFLVVGGEEPVVHIIDGWSLSKLSTFRLPAGLLCISSQSIAHSSRLLALCANSVVVLWEFGDVSQYLINPQTTRPIDSHPALKFTMRTTEVPRKVAITPQGDLLAVSYDTIISFIHEQWYALESRPEAYMVMPKAVLSLLFTPVSLLVLLDGGRLVEFSREDIFRKLEIGKNKPSRAQIGAIYTLSIKENTGEVELGELLEREAGRRKGRRMRGEGDERRIDMDLEEVGLAYTDSALYLSHSTYLFSHPFPVPLHISRFTLSSLSLQNCPAHYLADSQLQFLLDYGETVTDSHLVMAHAWPLYVVGTSRGRVFVVPLSAAHAILCLDAGTADPISCLFYCHNILISCSYGGVVQTWSLSMADLNGEAEETDETYKASVSLSSFSSDSGQKIDSGHHLPLKTFKIPYGRVLSIKQPHYIKEVLEGVPDHLWREKLAEWQRLLIGELEDDNVILLSLDAREVLCAFYGLRGGVKEALIHLLLDYLFITCGDGDCYLYNMTTLQLERIIPSYAVPYQAFRRYQVPELKSEDEEERSVQHQLLERNLKGLEGHQSHALAWVEYPALAGGQFPVLCFNIAAITESFAEMTEFPEQAEFIISLLNSWVPAKEDQEIRFQRDIQQAFKVAEPSVLAYIGTFGLENALSFRLPGSGSRWEVSSYISGLLSTSLLSVLSACVHFKPGLKSLFRKSVETHVERLSKRLLRFKCPSPLLLAYEVLGGNDIAYELLKSSLQLYSEEEKRQMMEEWAVIYESAIPCYDVENGEEEGSPSEPFSPSSITHWKPSKPAKHVALPEALSLLSLCALYLSGAFYSSTSTLVTALCDLLRSHNTGYITTAALLLHDGIKCWRPLITPQTFQEAAIILLHLHHTSTLVIRTWAKRALLSLGKADVPTFTDILKHEVALLATDRAYPDSVLTILEQLIDSHSPRLLLALPSVVDVILRSLDPKDILLRKICLGRATDVLELLVKRLPMVAFETNRQLLAVGTSGGSVSLYDLKSATLWKTLSSHKGHVNALSFSPSGQYLASYCITDLTIQVYKLEMSFLGLGSLQARHYTSISLEKVIAHVKTTGDLLNMVRMGWVEETVEMVREDGLAYCFSIG